jgi:hypothetical protein
MSVRYITIRRNLRHRAPEQFVTLDRVRVGIRARYSRVEDSWYVALLDPSGVPITGLRKLVTGIELFATDKHDERVPPGAFFVHSESRESPTGETLDVSSFLYYREAGS